MHSRFFFRVGQPTPISRSRIAASGLAVTLGLAVLMAGCGGDEADAANGQPGPGEAGPRPVTTAVAQRETVRRYVDSLGETNAFEYVEIKPQVSALVTAIHFEQGETVRAGDPLFSLERPPFEAAVRQARGEQQALEAQLAIAEREVERSASLVEEQLLSTQDFEALRSRVEELRGNLEAAQGRLQAAEISLAYTEIAAPMDAVVGFRRVDVGNLVGPDMATPLTTLRRLDPIYVDFSIPVDRFTELRERFRANGNSLEVRVRRLNNLDDERTAELTILGTAVDRATGTVDLRATMPNEDFLFWSQEPVRARVFLEDLPGTVVVPREAVQLSQQGPYVMVVEGIAEQPAEGQPVRTGTVQRADVRVGQRLDNNRVAILSGLEGGEEVVLEGQVFLFPGMPVEIVDDPGTLDGQGQGENRGQDPGQANGQPAADNEPS